LAKDERLDGAQGNPRLVITLVVLMGVSAFAVDASLPAIPLTAHALTADIGYVQLTVSLYLLGYGLGHIPAGYLADNYGRRPVVLWGTGMFVFVGLVSAAANSVDQLLVIRFLQGVFGAIPAVVVRSVARDIASGRELTRLMSLLTGSIGFAMIIAPFFGTGLMWLIGWRGGFAISPLVALMGWVLAVRYLPETLARPNGDRFIAGVKRSAVLFVKTPQAILGVGLIGLCLGCFLAFITMLSGVLIDHFEYTESEFVLAYAFVSTGFLVGGYLARYFSTNGDPVFALNATSFVLFICAISFGWGLFVEIPHFLFVLTVFAFFVGIGVFLPLMTSIVLQPFSDIAGMAAALLGTFQLFAGAATGAFHAQLDVSAVSSLGLNVVVIGVVVPATLIFGKRLIVRGLTA